MKEFIPNPNNDAVGKLYLEKDGVVVFDGCVMAKDVEVNTLFGHHGTTVETTITLKIVESVPLDNIIPNVPKEQRARIE